MKNTHDSRAIKGSPPKLELAIALAIIACSSCMHNKKKSAPSVQADLKCCAKLISRGVYRFLHLVPPLVNNLFIVFSALPKHPWFDPRSGSDEKSGFVKISKVPV